MLGAPLSRYTAAVALNGVLRLFGCGMIDYDMVPLKLLAIPLSSLAIGLSGPADGGRMLSCALLGGLLVVPTKLHLAIDALPLKLLLERPERLIHVVVTNNDLHIALASGYSGAGFRPTS